MAESLLSLRELVNLVYRSLPHRTQYFSKSNLLRPKEANTQLFQELRCSGPVSEHIIAEKLFKTNPSSNLYKAHKSQFKQVLLNSLFVLDLQSGQYSIFTQTENHNDRNVYVAKTLLSLGVRQLAKSIATKGLNTAQRFELWHNALRYSTILRDIASYEGRERDRKFFSEQYFRISSIELAQQHAMDVIGQLQCVFTKTGAEHHYLRKETYDAVTSVEAQYKLHQTYGLALALFRLRCAFFQIKEEYAAALKACDDFEFVLGSKFGHFLSQDRQNEIAFKRLVCHFHLRQYEHGLEVAKICRKLSPTGSNNWYSCQEYVFLLYMHTLRFDNASQLLEEVQTNQRFTLLPLHRQERWRIYGFYLDYAKGIIRSSLNTKNFRKYLQIHLKDKSGFYAEILLLEILILIDRRNFKQVIERMEALRKYSQRYLSDESSTQTRIFFKLLSLLEKTSFKPIIARQIAESDFKQLIELQSRTLDGIQILPYDWLWQHILNRLS